MASFNLTARLNLELGRGFKPVIDRLRREIQSVKGNLDFKIDPAANKALQEVNKSLAELDIRMQRIASSSAAARENIRGLSAASNSAASSAQKNARSNASANAVLAKTAQGAAEAASEVEEFGRVSGLAIRRFAGFTIATGAIFGLINAIKEATSEAISFERELARVAQVSNTSLGGLRDLTDEIGRLSTGLGVSSTELLVASRTLRQAGFSASQTKDALEAIALTDLAPTFDSITTTTEGAIAVLRQFGLEANDLESVLGSINEVAGQFAVESGDIIAAIRRAGGVFAAATGDDADAKRSVQEFIALFTSVRATTRETAESIAVGLRTIFSRIQRGSTIEALRGLGIELTDLEGKFIGPFEAVKRLSEGLANLESTDIQFAAIVEELGGIRQIGKIIPLIQQFGTAEEALNKAIEGQDSLFEDAAVAQETLQNALVKTRERFLELIREITNSTTFRTVASAVLSLANTFITLADSLRPLLPLVTAIAAAKSFGIARQFVSGFRRGAGGQVSPTSVGEAAGGVFNTGGASAAQTSAQISSVTQNTVAVDRNTSSQIQDTNAERASASAQTGLINALAANSSALSLNTTAMTRLVGLLASRPAVVAPTFVGGRRRRNTGGTIQRFARGGKVRGSSDSDTVDIKARPGEYILTKQIVKSIGEEKLDQVNRGEISLTDAIASKGASSTKTIQNISNQSTSNPQPPQALRMGGETVRRFENIKNISTNTETSTKDDTSSEKAKISEQSSELRQATSGKKFNLSERRFATGGRVQKLQGGSLVGRLRNREFSPTLTSRGVAPGNVGRKKQFLQQKVVFLGKKAKEGTISEQELQEFVSLSKKLKSIQQRRTERFSDFLGSDRVEEAAASIEQSNRRRRRGGGGGIKRRFFQDGGFIQALQTGGRARRQKASSAYVFDFDDTLAATNAQETPSFSQFRDQRAVNSASATRYASLAKRRASQGDDIFVLTARGFNQSTRAAINNFMSTIGAPAKGIIGVGDLFNDETKQITGLTKQEEGRLRSLQAGTPILRSEEDSKLLKELKERKSSNLTIERPIKISTAEKKSKVLSQLANRYQSITFLDDNAENVLAASRVSENVRAVQADPRKAIRRRNSGGSVTGRIGLVGGGIAEIREELREGIKKKLVLTESSRGRITQGSDVLLERSRKEGLPEQDQFARSKTIKEIGSTRRIAKQLEDGTIIDKTFGAAFLRPPEAKSSLEGIVKLPGNEKGAFRLEIGSLKSKVSENIEDDILNGVVTSIKSGAKKLSADIQDATPVQVNAGFLKEFNIDQVIGNIFEGMIAATGAPFEAGEGKSKANDPFDFPIGLGAAASNFVNSTALSKETTDAKSSLTGKSVKSLFNKIRSQYKKEALTLSKTKDFEILQNFKNTVSTSKKSPQKPTPSFRTGAGLSIPSQRSISLRSRISSSVGQLRTKTGRNINPAQKTFAEKKLKEIREGQTRIEDLSASRLSTAGSFREFAQGRPETPDLLREFLEDSAGADIKNRKTGGTVRFRVGGLQLEEVPVALTPGELVFQPDAVQQQGLRDLEMFNKTKDPNRIPKLATGGSVSVVPGSGNTDSFFTSLPEGSFVINKEASEFAIQNQKQQFKNGGSVSIGRQQFNTGGSVTKLGGGGIARKRIASFGAGGMLKRRRFIDGGLNELTRRSVSTEISVGSTDTLTKNIAQLSKVAVQSVTRLERLNAVNSSLEKRSNSVIQEIDSYQNQLSRLQKSEAEGAKGSKARRRIQALVVQKEAELAKITERQSQVAKLKTSVENDYIQAETKRTSLINKARSNKRIAQEALVQRTGPQTATSFSQANFRALGAANLPDARRETVIQQLVNEDIRNRQRRRAPGDESINLGARNAAFSARSFAVEGSFATSSPAAFAQAAQGSKSIRKTLERVQKKEIESLAQKIKANNASITSEQALEQARAQVRSRYGALATEIQVSSRTTQLLNAAKKKYYTTLSNIAESPIGRGVGRVNRGLFGTVERDAQGQKQRRGGIVPGIGRGLTSLPFILASGAISTFAQQAIGRETPQRAAAGAALSSGVLGASSGAAAGLVFGPIGAAIGGVAGGIFGAVNAYKQAFDEVADEIRRNEVSEAIKEFTDSIKKLSESGELNIDSLNESLAGLSKQAEENVTLVAKQNSGAFFQQGGFSGAVSGLSTDVTNKLFKDFVSLSVGFDVTDQDNELSTKVLRDGFADLATKVGDLNQKIVESTSVLGSFAKAALNTIPGGSIISNLFSATRTPEALERQRQERRQEISDSADEIVERNKPLAEAAIQLIQKSLESGEITTEELFSQLKPENFQAIAGASKRLAIALLGNRREVISLARVQEVAAEEYKKLIGPAAELIDKQRELAQAVSLAEKSVSLSINRFDALARSVELVSSAGDKYRSQIDLLNGTFSNFQAPQISGNLELFSDREFENLQNRISATGGDNELTREVNDRLSLGRDLQRLIPRLAQSAASRTDIRDQNIQQSINQVLRENEVDPQTKFGLEVSAALNRVLSTESNRSQDLKNFQSIIENELIDATTPVIDAAEKAGDALLKIETEIANQLRKTASQFSETISQANDKLQEAAELGINRDLRLREALGDQVTVRDIFSNLVERINIRTRRAGRGNIGANANDIADEIIKLREAQANINKRQQEAREQGNEDEFKKQEDALQRNTRQQEALQGALELLATDVSALTKVESELAELQRRRDQGESLLQRVAAATFDPKAALQLNREIVAATKLLAGRRDFGPGEIELGADFLRQLGQIRGNDRETRDLVNQRLLGAIGGVFGNFGAAAFGDFAIGFGEEEQNLRNKFDELIKLQKGAVEKQAKLLQDAAQRIKEFGVATVGAIEDELSKKIKNIDIVFPNPLPVTITGQEADKTKETNTNQKVNKFEASNVTVSGNINSGTQSTQSVNVQGGVTSNSQTTSDINVGNSIDSNDILTKIIETDVINNGGSGRLNENNLTDAFEKIRGQKDQTGLFGNLLNEFTSAIVGFKVDDKNNQLTRQTLNIDFAEDIFKRLFGFADGGSVSVGNISSNQNISPQDTVPAMLQPGEFVVRKSAAVKNASLLNKINRGDNVRGFQDGGFVQSFGRASDVLPPERRLPVEISRKIAKGQPLSVIERDILSDYYNSQGIEEYKKVQERQKEEAERISQIRRDRLRSDLNERTRLSELAIERYDREEPGRRRSARLEVSYFGQEKRGNSPINIIGGNNITRDDRLERERRESERILQIRADRQRAELNERTRLNNLRSNRVIAEQDRRDALPTPEERAARREEEVARIREERIRADRERIEKARQERQERENLERERLEKIREERIQKERERRGFANGGNVTVSAGSFDGASPVSGVVTGGPYVPSKDTIPAMLQPGEFVVRRSVAQKNTELLYNLNRTGKVPGFKNGGTVTVKGFQTGAPVEEDPEILAKLREMSSEGYAQSMKEAAKEIGIKSTNLEAGISASEVSAATASKQNKPPTVEFATPADPVAGARNIINTATESPGVDVTGQLKVEQQTAERVADNPSLASQGSNRVQAAVINQSVTEEFSKKDNTGLEFLTPGSPSPFRFIPAPGEELSPQHKEINSRRPDINPNTGEKIEVDRGQNTAIKEAVQRNEEYIRRLAESYIENSDKKLPSLTKLNKNEKPKSSDYNTPKLQVDEPKDSYERSLTLDQTLQNAQIELKKAKERSEIAKKITGPKTDDEKISQLDVDKTLLKFQLESLATGFIDREQFNKNITDLNIDLDKINKDLYNVDLIRTSFPSDTIEKHIADLDSVGVGFDALSAGKTSVEASIASAEFYRKKIFESKATATKILSDAAEAIKRDRQAIIEQSKAALNPTVEIEARQQEALLPRADQDRLRREREEKAEFADKLRIGVDPRQKDEEGNFIAGSKILPSREALIGRDLSLKIAQGKATAEDIAKAEADAAGVLPLSGLSGQFIGRAPRRRNQDGSFSDERLKARTGIIDRIDAIAIARGANPENVAGFDNLPKPQQKALVQGRNFLGADDAGNGRRFIGPEGDPGNTARQNRIARNRRIGNRSRRIREFNAAKFSAKVKAGIKSYYSRFNGVNSRGGLDGFNKSGGLDGFNTVGKTRLTQERESFEDFRIAKEDRELIFSRLGPGVNDTLSKKQAIQIARIRGVDPLWEILRFTGKHMAEPPSIFEIESAFRKRSGQEFKLKGTDRPIRIEDYQSYFRYLTDKFNRNPGVDLQLASGGPVPFKFAEGGSVNTDSVPAMLQPGEFVVKRDVAMRNGGFLRNLNEGKVDGFRTGGFIGMRSGGSVPGMKTNIIEELFQNIFESQVNKLQDINRRVSSTATSSEIGFVKNFSREPQGNAPTFLPQPDTRTNRAIEPVRFDQPRAVGGDAIVPAIQTLPTAIRDAIVSIQPLPGTASGPVTQNTINRFPDRSVEPFIPRQPAIQTLPNIAQPALTSVGTQTGPAGSGPGSIVSTQAIGSMDRLSGAFGVFNSSSQQLSSAIQSLGDFASIATNLSRAADGLREIVIPDRIEVQVAPIDVTATVSVVGADENVQALKQGLESLVEARVREAINRNINPITGETENNFLQTS